jgi:predicted XRE-type DNA-binding protein
MEVNRKEWNTLMRDKTSLFIKDSVKNVMQTLQQEVILLMEQLSALQESLRKKDM